MVPEIRRKNKRPNHADDFCIAQVFVDEYALNKDPVVIADTKRRMDLTTATILSDDMQANAAHAPRPSLE